MKLSLAALAVFIAAQIALFGGAAVQKKGASKSSSKTASSSAAKKSASKTAAKTAPKKTASKTAAKKTASKTAPKTAARKTATPKKSSSSSSRSRTSSRRRVVRKPSGQQQPTPERYAEIQRALAERGYLEGSVSGKWGQESVDALKRFEKDQNFEPDGKIDSWVLIALGLGPQRASAAQQKKAEP